MRSGALNDKKAKDAPAECLLETILQDILKAASMPFEEWQALTPNPLVPLNISLGDGRQYRVTQEGVDAAHKLTEQVWLKREDFRQTFSRDKFNCVSFQAIGETILDCRSHIPKENAERVSDTVDDTFFTAMASDYDIYLDLLADAERSDIDRHIPCHLFHRDQNVPPFDVGPVQFLPRTDWINRYVKSATTLGHIQNVQSGKITYDDLRGQALSQHSDRDLRLAWEILSALRNFDWIATIRMRGHEQSQAHHKASVIVGLAIDAVGLRFQAEDARKFTKAGRQHLYSEERLASDTNGRFHRGWSVQMPGLGASPGALVKQMQSERPFLDAAGQILNTYVLGRQTGTAHHFIESWINALHWVGEARREASDFKAIVNYGCAADGLTGAGGKAAEITSFAEAALNPKNEPTQAGVLNISDAVTKVYQEGRNRLAHGEVPGLFEDLSAIRAIGDALLVNLFDAVTFELAKVIDAKHEILNLKRNKAYRALAALLRQRV